MRLNLNPIRKIVEDITMNDTCLITVDTEGTADDTWDEETGTYIPPVNDRDTVYAGSCSLYPFSSVIQQDEQGGEDLGVTRYWLGLPVSSDVTVPVEALVQITAVDPTNGDPELVDKLFIVDGQEWLSMASSRRLKIRELRAKP